MKGLKRLFALIVIVSLITFVPTLVSPVYSWDTKGCIGGADSSTRQNIESSGTRGMAGGTVEHQVPAETPAVEAQGAARGTGSVVGSEGYGSAPGFPSATGRGNIPPFNAPGDTTDATTGAIRGSAAARTDSMMMQAAPATADPIKQAYQSGYKDGFTDGFTSVDMQATRGDMSMRGAAAPSPVSNDFKEGYRAGYWDGFSSSTAEHGVMAPGATRGGADLQQQPSDSMMQQDSSMMNGSTRGTIDSSAGAADGAVHDVPAETQAIEPATNGTRGSTLQNDTSSDMSRGSNVGAEGYGSAPGFPASTGTGNIPPFNEPNGAATRGSDLQSDSLSGASSSTAPSSDTSATRGSSTMGATDSSIGATGSMRGSAGMQQQPSSSMMMQPAPATTDPIKQAYQSGYKDGFTDGFKSSDIQHGAMGATRGDMSMRGAAAPSPVSNDFKEGYRSGFWEGFRSAATEPGVIAPGTTRGGADLQQQPSDSMMQQDSSMMNGSMRGTTDAQTDTSGTMRGGADLEGGNTQLDSVNGTTRGEDAQQDSSMTNGSMRGTTDSSAGAAQGSSY